MKWLLAPIVVPLAFHSLASPKPLEQMGLLKTSMSKAGEAHP